MKTIYIDAYSGIAGDMMVGALLALFGNEKLFRAELAKLPLEGYEIEVREDTKGGIAGTAFRVHEHHHHDNEEHHHVHRGLRDIEEIFTKSSLDPRIIRESLRAFALLAQAEAKVHGTTVDKIHFHEVGAIDSIVDIAGAFILMHLLGNPRVISSPLNVGSGTVRCAHGILPVPAPATLELLKDFPVYSLGTPFERVTPTGALLVRCLASAFSPLPSGKIVSIGYGLGEKNCPDIPNALRLVLLDSNTNDKKCESDFCALLETNIDDMSPQDFALPMEMLFAAGALDVWFEPIYMKKNRPAQKLCCLARLDKSDEMTEIILRQTTTNGVRRQIVSRDKLTCKIEEAETPLGKVRMKRAYWGTEHLRSVPEHDDLKRLAREHGLPLCDVRKKIIVEGE